MDSPEELLQKIAFAYRAWSQYDDTGFVEYEGPQPDALSRVEFSTHFQAPTTFRCRFQHVGLPSWHELTRDGDGALVRRGNESERYESFDSATAALAGVSLGVVCTVPRLLMWKDRDSYAWSVTQLVDPALLTEAEVDGTACRRISGSHPTEQLSIELLVDHRLYLIRRMIESQPFQGTTLRTFTTYHPRVVV